MKITTDTEREVKEADEKARAVGRGLMKGCLAHVDVP